MMQKQVPESPPKDPSQMPSKDQIQSSNILTRSSPQLPRIFADNSDKKSMVIYWSVFIVIIIITAALTTTVPDALQYRGTTHCSNPIGFDSKNILICNNDTRTSAGILVDGMTNFNQFILFNCKFFIVSQNAFFNYNGAVNISLYTVKKVNDSYVKDFTYLQNVTFNLIINAAQSSIIYGDKNTVLGFDNAITYLQSIKFANYVYIIDFPSQMDGFKNILPYITTINRLFSVFGVTLRYFFFVVVIASSTFFMYKLFKLFKVNRSAFVLEQKMAVILSILAIFFNDPFYIITITKPNPVNSFFSVMFLVNLLVYLFLFWITILDRVKDENQIIESNVLTWKKLLFNFIIWILCLVYYVIYSFQNFNNSPLMQTSDFNTGNMGYLAIFIILLIIILLTYLIGQHIRIFMKFHEKIWRNKLFVLFSIFFIIVIIAFFFMSGINIHEEFGKRVLILYVCTNLYVVYIQMMYTPTQEALESNYMITTIQQQQIMNDESPEKIEAVEINFASNYEEINEEGSEFAGQQRKVHSKHLVQMQKQGQIMQINEQD